MKTCLIITGGQVEPDFAGEFLKKYPYDRLIAVDGGLSVCKELHLVPDYAVGDFDTISPEILEEFRQIPYIMWESHQPEKDETDTELALRKAMALNCSQVAVLGALGGRFDHTIGNLHLLYPCLQKGIDAFLIDSRNKIYLLDGEKEFVRERLYGKYISFLPLTEQVEKITLKGFKYPLLDHDISIGTSLCISNELVEERGSITFEEGILICVECHD